jgi:hypothetical protein
VTGMSKMISEKITLFDRIFFLGWLLLLCSLPFPYLKIADFAGSNLTLGLILSILGGLVVILSLAYKVRKIDYLVLMITLFGITYTVAFFFWNGYGLVPLQQIANNTLISFIFIMTLFMAKNGVYSRKIGNSLINVYLYFIATNSIFVLFQFVAQKYGYSFYPLWVTNIGKISALSRLTGLMGEPEHVGLLTIGLIFIKRKTSFVKVVRMVCLIANILSFSATAWIISIAIYIRSIEKKNIMKNIITLLIISTLLLYIGNRPGLERIRNAMQLQDMSSFVRVIKGPAVYWNLDAKKQLTGIGPGDTSVYKEIYSGRKMYEIIIGDNFVNGIFSEMISYGLFLAILYNIIYYNLMSGKNRWHNFIFFEILRLGTSINNTSPFLVLLIPLIVENKETIEIGKQIKTAGLGIREE